MQKNITVIKYGTAVLTTLDFQGKEIMDANTITQHGDILNQYQDNLILVSSGAVGLGRALMKGKPIKANKLLQKRLLAEIGQPHLIASWRKAMPQKVVLQKLVTYDDLKRETSTNTIKAALENNFVYIFNFNDGVDETELAEDKDHTFGDNDHLAAEVAKTCASLAESNRIIFNTSSDGFIDKDTGKTIKTLYVEDINKDFINYHCQGTSRGGTGGMAEKLLNLKVAINNGIDEAWIINGKKPEQLKIVLDGGHVGTRIVKK